MGAVNSAVTGIADGMVDNVSKLPRIVPVVDIKQDSAGVLETVRKSNKPTIVTHRGRAAAVLLSIEAYERAEREREILYAIACGDREIADGEGVDLDDVLAEADALLGP